MDAEIDSSPPDRTTRTTMRGVARWLIVAAMLLVPAGRDASGADPEVARGGVSIDIVSHGWHTGIVLPITPEVIELCPPLAEFASYRTVEIGWGDEGFYRAESIGLGITVRAIAWPSPSVMHVVGLALPTEEEFARAEIVRLSLSPARFTALVTSIASDFAEPRSFADGRYGVSRFYRGRLPYHFPRTCNAWTLRKLADAGCSTAPFFGLRSEVAMHQVARFGEPIRLEPLEGKGAYALGALLGIGWIIGRGRRRTRAAARLGEAGTDGVAEADPPESASALETEGTTPTRAIEERSPEGPGPRGAWGVVVGSAVAMLIFTVLSANGHGWASTAARGALVVMTAGFTAAALRSWSRVTGGRGVDGSASRRARARRVLHAIGGAVALLATAVILSPM